MFKFLHAADLHLDSPLRAVHRYDDDRAELLTTATREALKNLVELAIEEQVAFLLIAGDLFDGDWDDCGTGLFFNRQMARLHEAGIPVIAIAGNHDAQSHMSRAIRPPENVRYLSDRRPETHLLEELRVAIHGQGFRDRKVPENLAEKYPAAVKGFFNIGLLHTSLAGSEEHETYAPCSVDDLRARGYDYWALGHVHQRWSPSEEEPVIAYSGNLQGRHIRETGAKGALLVTVEDSRAPTVEFRPLDVLRWEQLEISAAACETLDDLAAEVTAALRECRRRNNELPLVVRLVVAGASPLHNQLLAEEPAAREALLAATANATGRNPVWLEKIRFLTRPVRELDLAELADGPMGTVDSLLAGWLAEEADLSELQGVLKELCDKLPTALWEEEPRHDHPARLRELLAGVLPLLHQRLLDTGETA